MSEAPGRLARHCMAVVVLLFPVGAAPAWAQGYGGDGQAVGLPPASALKPGALHRGADGRIVIEPPAEPAAAAAIADPVRSPAAPPRVAPRVPPSAAPAPAPVRLPAAAPRAAASAAPPAAPSPAPQPPGKEAALAATAAPARGPDAWDDATCKAFPVNYADCRAALTAARRAPGHPLPAEHRE